MGIEKEAPGGLTDNRNALPASRGDELLRAVFHNTGDLILAVKPNSDGSGGVFVAANAAACRALNCDCQTLLRTELREIAGPHAAGRLPEFLRRLREKGSFIHETELLARDGSPVPVEAHARRLRLGGEDIIIIVARDLRPRRQMEKEIRVRRDWCQATLASLGDAILTTDIAGRVTYLNRTARTLTGVSEAAAVGQPLAAVFRLLDPATGRPAALPPAGAPGKGANRVLVQTDGKRIAVSVTATPIIDDTGEPLGTVIACQDISERETVEKQLLYRLRLEEAVAAVGKILNSNEPVDFPLILSILGQAVSVCRSYIFRIGETNTTMNKTAEWCAAGVESRLRETQGISGDDYRWFTRKIIGREPVVIPDIEDMPPEAAPEQQMYRRLGAKALLCMPVNAPAGDVSGLLGFADTQGSRVWLKEDIDLLQTAAVMVGAYFDRKENNERIRYMSYHDRLTGLFNKGFFEEETIRLDASRQLPVSVIIGDLNGLKFVNDAFGHQEGDAMLVRVADIMRASCRSEDIIARWGGDEFAVLLPQTSEEAALGIVKRMQEVFAATDITPIKLSVALGSATKTEPGQNIRAVIKEAEDRMYRNKLLGRSARSNIITSLGKSLWERSYETEEHALRLRDLALYLGRQMGLSAAKLDELSLLAMLHDIGKIGIPDEILRKQGPLTAEEFAIMRKHPEIGYRITSSAPELAPVSYGVMTHHENWDGSGYPHGLKGEEIPLIARIIAIIDAYDVMLHSQTYKRARSRAAALAEIEACAGTQFDPHLARHFLAVIGGYAGFTEAAAAQSDE
ncbi:MAG: HD domain-containing phosphohydrolase [bacterium]